MSTDTGEWKPSRIRAEEPEAAASELSAWSPGGAATAAVADEVPEALYCDNCWAPLGREVTECADCGRLVAEMEAERNRVAQTDRQWRPTRRGRPSATRARRLTPAKAKAAPPPAPAKGASASVIFSKIKPLLVATGIGLLLGGVAVLSFWISIATYN